MSTVPPNTPPTLIQALRALEGSERLLGVYDRRGKKRTDRPYAEVVARARGWATWLEQQGVRPGEVVFLCLQTSHDLLEAFFGAVVLGALPCCLALPRAVGGLDVFRRRLALLAERFPGGTLIAAPDVAAEAGRPALTPPESLDGLALAPLAPVDPGALCYVQLTSGSTRAPKAVAISHANLAANAHGIFRAGGGGSHETFVSWLPLYHDMGLVGIVFTALFHGADLVLMPPETFVGTPLKWLEALSEPRAEVITSAPNFGYQWCVDRIGADKLRGLDLSRWRIACCGAEMVRPETLRAFTARFAPFGFREGAFIPCYGMAETTLAVTFCPPGRAPLLRDGRVSCGPPIEGLEVEVRDPASGAPLPDGVEGEVCARGSSLFQGYFLDPEATAAVVREGWFHTGDLGYLADGELYVTGRLKDLIILDGVNVAPHELEWIGEELLPCEGGRAAAFSVEPAGREVPVLVVEVRAVPEPALLEEVERRVAADLGAPLFDLVLVRRGSLPKTSSGKVQRGEVRRRYQQGTLEQLWARREASE